MQVCERQNVSNYKIVTIVSSGIITFAMLILLFVLKGVAPFGTKSLTVMDANIQYIDFFSYYYDVLVGENSILYTFTKLLGGTNIAVFSYYLSSPFNILILLFGKVNIHSFFDISVALKLSLAAMTFSFFAQERFTNLSQKKNTPILLLTAIGYALCQYNLAQSSNIMWLDGVYMLPLILLQVSNIVKEKNSAFLPFIIALSIWFNWYSAGINCIFSAFWFIFEFLLYITDHKIPFKRCFMQLSKYIVDMLLGVLISCILFLPTIGSLTNSNRGVLQLSDLFDLSFLGEFPTCIQKYSYGAISELGSPALFCGGLALVLALFALFSHKIDVKKRVVLWGMFISSILLLYWHPFYTAFSLFKKVESYNYRYSYVVVFSLLTIALIGAENFTKQEGKLLLRIAAVVSLAQIVLHYCRPEIDYKYLYITFVMIFILAILYWTFASIGFARIVVKKAICFIVLTVGLIDIFLNGFFLMNYYVTNNNDVKNYKIYRAGQEETISTIKSEDKSIYRISQTETRNMLDTNLTANYNEGMAYNYASISSYTSAPDDIQRNFLDKLGYPICGENMCITNTSILGADSLLGVKYVLSPYYIQGLKKVSGRDVNNKRTYLNPYAFPFAFTYAPLKSVENGYVLNPFEYQNDIYRNIFNINEDLYYPISFSIQTDENSYDSELLLNVNNEEKTPIYGIIPGSYDADSYLYVDNTCITKYRCWLSPNVFYVPHSKGESCVVKIQSTESNFDLKNSMFYACNLDVLKKCSEIANNNKANIITFENGKVAISVNDAKVGDRLFMSIPQDDGWKITLNGKPAEYNLVGNCLYSIKLDKGANNIIMKYSVKYLREGMAITLFSTICYCVYLLLQTHKIHNRIIFK